MTQLILMAESAPLFYAMQEANHEPDDMGVDDWLPEDPAPLAACDHCGDSGRVNLGGGQADCPMCAG